MAGGAELPLEVDNTSERRRAGKNPKISSTELLFLLAFERAGERALQSANVCQPTGICLVSSRVNATAAATATRRRRREGGEEEVRGCVRDRRFLSAVVV